MRTLVWIYLLAMLMSPSSALAQQSSISEQEYNNILKSIDFEAHEINAERFEQLARSGNAVILDLRSREEYAQSHIKKAKHIGSDIDEKKLQHLVPSKDSTVLIYCRNSIGTPSRMLSLTVSSLPQFIALGYPNTYYLRDINPEDEQLIQKLLNKAE